LALDGIDTRVFETLLELDALVLGALESDLERLDLVLLRFDESLELSGTSDRVLGVDVGVRDRGIEEGHSLIEHEVVHEQGRHDEERQAYDRR